MSASEPSPAEGQVASRLDCAGMQISITSFIFLGFETFAARGFRDFEIWSWDFCSEVGRPCGTGHDWGKGFIFQGLGDIDLRPRNSTRARQEP